MPIAVPANRIDTASLKGSTIMLTNATKRANIKRPTQQITHIEPETNPNFVDQFVEGCQFESLPSPSGRTGRGSEENTGDAWVQVPAMYQLPRREKTKLTIRRHSRGRGNTAKPRAPVASTLRRNVQRTDTISFSPGRNSLRMLTIIPLRTDEAPYANHQLDTERLVSRGDAPKGDIKPYTMQKVKQVTI